MPAPLLASSHEMAAAMRAEASVSEIIRMAKLSSFTLVGIGSMHETATIVRSGIITQNELFRLRMAGAVGDVLCHFVNENGELIPNDIEERLISTPLEQLRAMDNVVGLAAGAQKARKPSAPFCAAAISTCSSPMSRRQLCFSRASERP